MQKAIANSYQLKISELDISLSKYAAKELASLYFPTLSARFNTEYQKDLTGGVARVTPIGSIVLAENTMFQDSFSVNLSYDLLGTRRRRRLLAKKEVEQSKLIYHKNLKDLKLRILELYTQALLTYKELKAKKEILSLQQQLLRLKERLFKAGTISKIEVANEAIRLAKVMEETDRLNTSLEMVLEDIAFYTRQHYFGFRVSDFGFREKEIKIPELRIPKSEIRIYELEIEKKKAELRILRRERFPQCGLYSNYTFYGSNRDDLEEALRDLEQRNWAVGVFMSIPLFAGFKTFVRGKRLKLEIQRLELERDKKIAELKSLYAKTSKAVSSYKQELETKKELIKNVKDKTAMIERLNSQQITDKVVLLNQQIELITQRLEFEKVSASKIAAIKKLHMLRDSDFGGRGSGKKLKLPKSESFPKTEPRNPNPEE